MTTIEDTLTYIDGSKANGRLVVAWKPFTVGSVNAAGGELEWEIVEGAVSISLYSNANALPLGSYYVAKYELESGEVYLEQWMVPNLPTVNLGQVRVSFPPTPSVMISPLQLTSLGATPGMFLMWDGSRWVPGYPSTFNLDPNWIAILMDSQGNDVSVVGSPVSVGNSVTINIPSASSTARGVVTTGAQSIAGPKTLLSTATVGISLQFVSQARVPIYGELLGSGAGVNTLLSFGGNFKVGRVSPTDRPYIQADKFIGGTFDMATAGVVPIAVMPGNLASPAKVAAAIQLPVTGSVDWSGIGTDTAGAIWLRTGTLASAGFLYLDTAGNVTCRELRMDPYQHLNPAGAEAVRSDATMVMYSSTTDWAGYGVNSIPEIWFRMGPNVAGSYYRFGAGTATFPNLSVDNIIVTGGLTLPPGVGIASTYSVNGSVIGSRAELNLIAGDHAILQGVDNFGAGRVDITVASTGGTDLNYSGDYVPGTYTDGDIVIASDGIAYMCVKATDTPPEPWTGTGIGIAGPPGPQGPPGAGASQTPWTSNIDGAGHSLTNTSTVSVTTHGLSNYGVIHTDDVATSFAGFAAQNDVGNQVGLLIYGSNVAAAPRRNNAAIFAPYNLSLYSGGTETLVCTAAGRVGIGWTPTTYLLEVNGDINLISGAYRIGGVALAAANVGAVPTTRQVIAGAGLTGGGALSADVTLVAKAMGASGGSHAAGIVPDPGATLGATRYLREDASWAVPAGAGGGLTDPTTTKGDLLVRGAAAVTRLGVTTDGFVLTADSAQTLGVKWAAAVGGGGTPAGATGQVQFNSASAFGASANLFWDNGNTRLGIGTSTPQERLHLFAAGDNAMLFECGAVNSATFKYKRGTQVWWSGVGTQSDNNWTLYDQNNIRTMLTVTTTGCVGILMSSTIPAVPLQIGIGTSGSPSNCGLEIWRLSNVNDAVGNLNIYTTDAPAADKGGSIGLGGSISSFAPYPYAKICGRSETGTGYAGYLQFITMASSSVGTERMRITSTGLVGIGKTPVTYRLEVSGDVDTTGTYRINGTPISTSQTPWTSNIDGGGFHITNVGKGNVMGTASGSVYVQANANILLYTLGADNWVGMGTDASGDFWLRTGLGASPSGRFRISAGGYLFYGSDTNPDFFYLGPNGVMGVIGDLEFGPFARVATFSCVQDGPSNSGAILFKTKNLGTSAERMRITAVGGISLSNLPSTNPGAGSKQLWYDPADFNRVKYAP